MLTATWLATPADGSPIYGATVGRVQDFANTGIGSASTNLSAVSATASTVFTGSGSTPACTNLNNCATASYSVADRFGDISLSFATSANCTPGTGPCGPNATGPYAYAEAVFNGSVNTNSDGIQIGTIAGGTGLLEVPYLMQGTIGGSGAPVGNGYGGISADLGDLNNPDTVVFGVELSSSGPYVVSQDLANGSTLFYVLTPDAILANTWDYTAYGTIIIPVSSGLQDALEMDVVGSSDVYAGPAYNPTMWFNLTDDPQIGGAQFYNSAGTTLLTGVNITSASGFDYTQPIPSSSVPEPATFALIGSALVALAMRRRTGSARKAGL
jgi:hypothetical protein